MPVKAYILVDISTDVKTQEILDKLNSISGVKTAEAVSGPHDIMVVVEAADLKSLGDIVISKVRTIEGVTKTITCCCV
ncbi:MAG TPA: Lrp/AsnC ligand binding domain-containing protein [Candidatus Hypogeohydataceae bacterium YC41]